jgi:hypothetical protein
MENAKNNKDEFYHNNSIRGKSKEQFPLSLFSETGAEQYFAAQRHLKTQKQFYGQLNYNKSTTKTSLSYETQTSYQPLAIPPHLDSIPLSINPASFPTTQSVSNSDKSGHNNTSSFSIGDELGELLTMDKDTEKQGAPLNEASSISFQGNNIFFKYQDGNDVESLLNDPHFLNFNLMSSNPQWQSNKLLISSTQPSDHKEQEKQASKENERNESDVFNELVSLAQNHNYMKNPHIPSLDHGEQIARNNEESNFIPENVDHRNSQYSEYYFHGFPNFQCHNNR